MVQPVSTQPLGRTLVSPLRFVLLASWLSVFVLCVAQLLVPQAVEAYGLYSFVIGMVLLGLPHGALDHLVPFRVGWTWAGRPLGLGLYLLVYVALAAAYFALWLVAPTLAFFGFLMATVLHWGQGDLRFLEIFLGRLRPNRLATAVSILLRGSLPIVVPVLAFPATAESLYEHAAHGLGLNAIRLELASPVMVACLGVYMLMLLIAYAFFAVRSAPNRAALWIDALEVLLLIVLFGGVPAYMSVGIYFIVWHSLRHLARLIILRPEHASGLKAGEWVRPVVRLALELLPITCAALLLLGGLYVWKIRYATGLESFVALYLVMISAITKPHLLLTALMDYAPRKEGF
jgi:beta-carotene 15,15'-dioxygenase